MSSISNLVRHKRFKIKDDIEVKLFLGLDSSETVSGTILDCSLNGLFVRFDTHSDYLWTESTIVPNSKILVDDQEIPIGRLVIRRVFQNSKKEKLLAFSTIDSRVPVGGILSKYLEMQLGDSNNEFEMELSEKGFTLADFLTSANDNVDIFDRCEKFSVFWKQLSRSGKFAYYYPRSSKTGARISVKHSNRGKEKQMLMFGSNDYLGLSGNDEVIEACNAATSKFGVGSTGTAPTAGTTVLHEKLCKEIASMHNNVEAIVFPSGYAANLGIIAGLARPGDLIIADNISHASLQDGMKLSGASYRFYKHNNMDHLISILQKERQKYAGCLIVTEGMFSMNGSLGRLDEIIPIAKEFNSRVMADQGHCFGILGESFTGTAELLGVGDDVDISMGLFSKGLGTLGGFVTGPKPLMDWFKAYARSLMFATSFPPGIAAATLKSLEIVKTGVLQRKLAANVKQLVTGLVELGVPVSPDHFTPIVPIPIWNEEKMGIICRHLADNGVYALPVIYPVVAKDRCQFRFSVTSNFSESDISLTLKILEEGFNKARINFTDVVEKMNSRVKISA